MHDFDPEAAARADVDRRVKEYLTEAAERRKDAERLERAAQRMAASWGLTLHPLAAVDAENETC